MDVASINHDYYVAHIIALLLRPGSDGRHYYGYPRDRWAALRLVAPQWDRLACAHRAEHERLGVTRECRGWPELRRTLVLLGDSRHLVELVRLRFVITTATSLRHFGVGMPRQPNDVSAGERRALARLDRLDVELKGAPYHTSETVAGDPATWPELGRTLAAAARPMLKLALAAVARHVVPHLDAAAHTRADNVLDDCPGAHIELYNMRVTRSMLVDLRAFARVEIGGCTLSRRASLVTLAGSAVQLVVGVGMRAADARSISALRSPTFNYTGFFEPIADIVAADDVQRFLTLVGNDPGLLERALEYDDGAFDDYQEVAGAAATDNLDAYHDLPFLALVMAHNAVRILGWLLRDTRARAVLTEYGETPGTLLEWARGACPANTATLRLLEEMHT